MPNIHAQRYYVFCIVSELVLFKCTTASVQRENLKQNESEVRRTDYIILNVNIDTHISIFTHFLSPPQIRCITAHRCGLTSDFFKLRSKFDPFDISQRFLLPGYRRKARAFLTHYIKTIPAATTFIS